MCPVYTCKTKKSYDILDNFFLSFEGYRLFYYTLILIKKKKKIIKKKKKKTVICKPGPKVLSWQSSAVPKKPKIKLLTQKKLI